MQLPIDIPELLKIATDLKEVSNTPLSVSVFIDDSADDGLISHVRAAFAGAGAHTRVTISYIDDDPINCNSDDDIVVIIAGDGKNIGEQAARVRDEKIAVMIVTDDPETVSANAKESGYPIPEADIISPVALDKVRIFEETAVENIPFVGSRLAGIVRSRDLKSAVKAAKEDSGAQDGGIASSSALTDEGKIVLNAETEKILDCRMGEWILAASPEKKLAFAYAFPFVRRPLANDSVTSTALQNAAVGFVPLIPGADLPIMTLNQAKMVLQISTAYGQPLDADRIKEVAAVVAGGFLFRNIARSITKIVPFAGWIVSGAVGFAGTEAMGKAVIEYFEAGGDIVGVAKVVQTARDKAVDTAKKAADTPAGQKVIDMAKSGIGSAASNLRTK